MSIKTVIVFIISFIAPTFALDAFYCAMLWRCLAIDTGKHRWRITIKPEGGMQKGFVAGIKNCAHQQENMVKKILVAMSHNLTGKHETDGHVASFPAGYPRSKIYSIWVE